MLMMPRTLNTDTDTHIHYQRSMNQSQAHIVDFLSLYLILIYNIQYINFDRSNDKFKGG